jgi:hypothetical protein
VEKEKERLKRSRLYGNDEDSDDDFVAEFPSTSSSAKKTASAITTKRKVTTFPENNGNGNLSQRQQELLGTLITPRSAVGASSEPELRSNSIGNGREAKDSLFSERDKVFI